MRVAAAATTATARALAVLLRRRLRGSTRLTLFFAHRFRGLQELAINFAGRNCYLDLREASSHSLLAGWFPEPMEREIVQRILRPGQFAVDVGGHWGLYTVLLSNLAREGGRVFTFEPSPVNLPALSRTVGELENATLFPVALGDAPDPRQLSVPADASMAHFTPIEESVREKGRTFDVPVETLDAMVETDQMPAPDFMKCDVEGAEALVFRGATELLDRPLAPVILFESHPAGEARLGLGSHDAWAFLGGLHRPRYRFFAVGDDASLRPLHRAPEALTNIFAFPEGRLGQM